MNMKLLNITRLTACSFMAVVVTVLADQQQDTPSDKDITDKIVGGKPAFDGEFPAFAHPVYSGGCFNTCGGTLIYPNVVMTAAHCADAWLFAGQVAIGANSLCAEDAEDTVGIEGVYNHPLYDDFDYINDIALVQLSRASTVTPAVWNTDLTAPADNDLVTVCGFGDTQVGNGNTDVLLKVTLRAVASDVCVEQYEDIGGIDIDPNVHLCAAALDRGACYGDSGGPLYLFGSNTVSGIVSFGVGCALPEFSGVYTRVSTYDSWIKKTICQISDIAPTDFSCDEFCGDGVCDSVGGFEDCVSCASDCGTCPPGDDGLCEVGETCSTSPADCGPCEVIAAECPVGINDSGLALTAIGVSITYELSVPAGDGLTCTTSGGTGDADLLLIQESFVCESNGDGNDESCVSPAAVSDTTASIQVTSFEPFADVSLVCTCAEFIPQCGDGFCTEDAESCETCPDDCGVCPPTCEEGINETGLNSSNEELLFHIAVSAGEAVACVTSGGSGDAVLVMYFNDIFVCYSDSEFFSPDESCDTGVVTQDGTVKISLSPWSASYPLLGVNLVCTCTDSDAAIPIPSPTDNDCDTASPPTDNDCDTENPINNPFSGSIVDFIIGIFCFWL